MPDSKNPAYLGTLEELALIEIEFSWKLFAEDRLNDRKATRPRSISQLLSEFPSLRHPDILPELLKQEFYVRHQIGDKPDPDEYVAEYPQIIDSPDLLLNQSLPEPKKMPVLSERVGDVLGHYRLIEELGEGGFGCVFLAEQTEPIRRQVALKIIKPGMDTKSVIARFEAERQVLALMNHPNIAKVLDAGATDSGRPFFVMELVKGIPITEYCDRNSFTTKERLKLFVNVCEAIQHAHQKGIIHRDIKPSNILVADVDGQPMVKVIDFGIAKATQQRVTEKTLFTQLGQVIGTPQYMSPEQAETSILDIDTRSDVYSLGILLYELLTGTTPIREEDLRQAGYDEMLRLIREADTPKPSTRISQSGEAVTTIAKHRQIEPRKLGSLVRGDLDWIVMKALAKERSRRYDTVSDLASDMLRFLSNEPVSAGPPSKLYRLRKFTSKYRAAIATASALASMILVSTVVSTWLFINANYARANEKAARKKAEDATQLAQQRLVAENTARRQAQTAEADAVEQAEIAVEVTDFLANDVLGQANPYASPDRDLKLRVALDNASEKIDSRFKDKPLVDAAIRNMIGNTYRGLGEYSSAEEHLRRARQLREEHLGAANDETLRTVNNLALVYKYQSRHEDAARLIEQNIQQYVESAGADSPLVLSSRCSLAGLLIEMGKYDESELMLLDTLARQREQLGDTHRDTLATMILLAKLYRLQSQYAEAKSLYEQALDPLEQLLGRDHPDWFNSLSNLATLHFSMGDFAAAQRAYEQVVEIQKRVLGESHLHTLIVQTGLAMTYLRREQYAQAESLLHNVIQGTQAIYGEEHPSALLNYGDLGLVQRRQGRYDEAEKNFEIAYQARKTLYGEQNASTLRLQKLLASTYALQGRSDEAALLYEQVVEGLGKILGDDNPEVLDAVLELAKAHKAAGNDAAAEPHFLKNLESRKAKLGADHPHTLTAMHYLAWFRTAQNRFEDAASIYDEVISRRTRVLGADHPDTLVSMSNLGTLNKRMEQYDDALELYGHVFHARRKVLGDKHDKTLQSLLRYADLLIEMERFEEALPLYRQAVEWTGEHSREVQIQHRLQLGQVLWKSGDFQDAERILLDVSAGLDADNESLPSDHRIRLQEQTRAHLEGLYEAWEKPSEADKWR